MIIYSVLNHQLSLRVQRWWWVHAPGIHVGLYEYIMYYLIQFKIIIKTYFIQISIDNSIGILKWNSRNLSIDMILCSMKISTSETNIHRGIRNYILYIIQYTYTLYYYGWHLTSLIRCVQLKFTYRFIFLSSYTVIGCFIL